MKRRRFLVKKQRTRAGQGTEPLRASLLDNPGDRNVQLLQSLRGGPIGSNAETIRALLFQNESNFPQFLSDVSVLLDHGYWRRPTRPWKDL